MGHDAVQHQSQDLLSSGPQEALVCLLPLGSIPGGFLDIPRLHQPLSLLTPDTEQDTAVSEMDPPSDFPCPEGKAWALPRRAAAAVGGGTRSVGTADSGLMTLTPSVDPAPASS